MEPRFTRYFAIYLKNPMNIDMVEIRNRKIHKVFANLNWTCPSEILKDKEEGGEYFCVNFTWFDTPEYFIAVTVWDNATGSYLLLNKAGDYIALEDTHAVVKL